jgi:hypothetical protein
MLFYLILFLQPAILIDLSHKKDATKYNLYLRFFYYQYGTSDMLPFTSHFWAKDMGYGTNFDAIGEYLSCTFLPAD